MEGECGGEREGVSGMEMWRVSRRACSGYGKGVYLEG